MPNVDREIVRISWEEWKASRAAKRAVLERLGLDAPSIRSRSSSDRRLRAAFGGFRAPVATLERKTENAEGERR